MFEVNQSVQTLFRCWLNILFVERENQTTTKIIFQAGKNVSESRINQLNRVKQTFSFA